MVGETLLEYAVANSTKSESGKQNICVENDFYEISLSRSSSESYPRFFESFWLCSPSV